VGGGLVQQFESPSQQDNGHARTLRPMGATVGHLRGVRQSAASSSDVKRPVTVDRETEGAGARVGSVGSSPRVVDGTLALSQSLISTGNPPLETSQRLHS